MDDCTAREPMGRIIGTVQYTVIAGRTIEQWEQFACRDDCLDQMVPSDLRALIAALK